ncbi:MAG: hypothetical protein ACI8P0_000767 [Planctomycetaceae bacterium]
MSDFTSDSYRHTADDAELNSAAVSGTREIPAWAVSLVVHVVVLLLLSNIIYVTAGPDTDNLISSVVDELDERDYKFDVTVADMVGNASEANTLTSSQAASQVLNQNQQEEIKRELEEELLEIEAPPINDVMQPPSADLTSVVETTGTSEKAGGVEGSIDRMTYEVINSLKERETLVVWLFDESGSLAIRRNEIADRFENIYGQLDSLKAERNSPLKTAIVGFGKDIHFYTPEPISDIGKAVNLVRGIKDDDSGKEMAFTAVGQVVNKWKKFRSARNKHNCMIVLVTDERGDDFEHIETVAAMCSKTGFRVYCIGNSSPFGREKGYVRYKYTDGFEVDVPVDQGPESVRMEVLDLPYWGARGVDNGRISSGLGPYALTRLCAETGGLYLIAQDSRGKQFDVALMKDYLPDYRPMKFYEKDVAGNPTKMALLRAAEGTRMTRVRAPLTRFRADTDNALRVEATEAQKSVAILGQRVTEIVTQLEAGEKERDQLKGPRWQAAYDLAMGRALALQARAIGYNMMLAQMKVAPKTFEKEGNNTWTMVASGEVQTGPMIRKIVARATEYLSRVVDDHQGTPWAYLAELDLERQMGWGWRESYTNYAASGQMNGNAEPKKGVEFLEEVDPKTGKKKLIRRPPPPSL